jgi:hypothetical protein
MPADGAGLNSERSRDSMSGDLLDFGGLSARPAPGLSEKRRVTQTLELSRIAERWAPSAVD